MILCVVYKAFTPFLLTLFGLANQCTPKEHDLSPFFSARLRHFFTLKAVSPLFCHSYEGLMCHLKFVTIPRLVVATVLSSFLVSFSPSELRHGL
jgi:hypothetical protein